MTASVNLESPGSSPVVRRLIRVEATPAPEPGFIGEGHTAVAVLRGSPLSVSDPFVLLMDDRLDIAKRRQIGGAHPHAGLETVTLVLEGSISERGDVVSAGDAVWMTAGRGIIHSEHAEAEGRVRVLQLWIGLPAAHRFAAPAVQVLKRDEQPERREAGAVLRLYSGVSGTLRSSTRNLVPVTLAEVTLEPGARLELELPASHTGFLYVVSGGLTAGGENARAGDIAWLDRPEGRGASSLALVAGASGARAVLYAGEPHREALVQHGPFVADSARTITRFFHEYQSGAFQRLSGI